MVSEECLEALLLVWAGIFEQLLGAVVLIIREKILEPVFWVGDLVTFSVGATACLVLNLNGAHFCLIAEIKND